MYEVFGSVLICCMALSFVKSLEQKPFKESSFTVAIINKNEARFKCVGTLIHPTHVVTASHCVEDNSSKYVVVHSTSSFSLTKIDNAVPVIAIRFRRKVNGIRCEDNDIAVLRLGSVVNHEPIMLSEDDVGLKDGFLSKWNRKNNGDETICNLESIPIGIYDPKTCRQANEKKQHIYNNICGAPSTNATLVKGDSGSPLLTQNGTRLVLLGILYCKLNGVMNATYPAAFVRISMHDKWIQDVIKSSIEETTINTDVTTDSDIKETTFNAAPENNSPNIKFIILFVTFVLVLGALCTYIAIMRWKLEQNRNVNAELISLNNVLPAAVEPLSSPATVDKGG